MILKFILTLKCIIFNPHSSTGSGEINEPPGPYLLTIISENKKSYF